jgi:hypothetical protein
MRLKKMNAAFQKCHLKFPSILYVQSVPGMALSLESSTKESPSRDAHMSTRAEPLSFRALKGFGTPKKTIIKIAL